MPAHCQFTSGCVYMLASRPGFQLYIKASKAGAKLAEVDEARATSDKY